MLARYCMGGSIKRSFCGSSKLRLYTWFFSLSLNFFLTISLHHQIFLQREKEREKLTMAVSRKWACMFSAVLLLLFVGVMPTTSGTNGGISALTRYIYVYTHTHIMYMYMPFSCQKTRLALHFLCLYVCFVCPSGLRETKLSLSFFSLHYVLVKIL
jgi:hypothetical protein